MLNRPVSISRGAENAIRLGWQNSKSKSLHLICGFIFCPAKGTLPCPGCVTSVRFPAITPTHVSSPAAIVLPGLFLVFPCSTGSPGWRTAISEQLDPSGEPGRTRLASKVPSQPQRVGIRAHQNAAPPFARSRSAAPCGFAHGGP